MKTFICEKCHTELMADEKVETVTITVEIGFLYEPLMKECEFITAYCPVCSSELTSYVKK